MPKSPVFPSVFVHLEAGRYYFRFFRNLLLLIYAINIILNGNFDTDFPPIILFFTNFVAENVAKSVVG
jgi:hypothetical protein